MQAASDRKANESLQAAKAFAIQKDSSPPESSAPLMDCESFTFIPIVSIDRKVQWIPTSSTFKTPPHLVVN